MREPRHRFGHLAPRAPFGVGAAIDLVAAPHHRRRRVVRDMAQHATQATHQRVTRRQLGARPLRRILLELAQCPAGRDEVGVGDQGAHRRESGERAEDVSARAQDRGASHAHTDLRRRDRAAGRECGAPRDRSGNRRPREQRRHRGDRSDGAPQHVRAGQRDQLSDARAQRLHLDTPSWSSHATRAVSLQRRHTQGVIGRSAAHDREALEAKQLSVATPGQL
jgi:hypothetical protein